jgi:putative ABC transport system ATP-binding protein
MSVLELKSVGYGYNKKTKVLENINYQFEMGKVYSIVGKSGAGKTTLLSLLSGLTIPTEGELDYNRNNVASINRYDYRSQKVGVIFQSFNLLPHLTVIENILLSIDASGKKFNMSKYEIAKKLLERVNLDPSYNDKRVLHLSGGEQQRVAIARAISYNPDVILADEPTGNLDKETQDEIMEIFRSLAHDDNKCVIIVTHSPEVAALSDEVFKLEKTSIK